MLATTTQAQARHPKVADKDDDDADKKDDDNDSNQLKKGDSTDVNDYIDKNAKFDWNESKFKKLKAGKGKHIGFFQIAKGKVMLRTKWL